MLRISLLELVARGIPEGFLFVMAIYAFARRKIEIKPYLISVLAVVTFTFLFRYLDINFGVHIILNIIVLIVCCVFVCKIDLYVVVKGSMITTLLMLAVEMINVLILRIVLGDDFLKIVENPVQKVIAGLPGIVLFAIVIINGYYFLSLRKKAEATEKSSGEAG